MILFARILLLTAIFGLSVAESSAQTFLEAEDAVIGPDATVVKQNSFPSGQGATRLDSWRSEDLEQGLVGAPDEKESNSATDPDSPPDLTFDVSVESPGRYRLQSFAAVDSVGRENNIGDENAEVPPFCLRKSLTPGKSTLPERPS